MSNVKVSQDFNKFYGRAASAIEEAKKAENNMSTSPTPVGWKGQVVLLGVEAGVSKEKKDEKGVKTGGGNPWVNLEFGIVGDDDFTGKKFKKNFTFFDSKGATAADRFTWFLNQCENLGVSRDIRENHESPEELFNAVAALDGTFEAECVASTYSDDGKEMKVRRAADAVDNTDSMTPTDTVGSTSKAADVTDPQEGDEVPFLGKKWKVIARDGDDLQLQHPEREGVTRSVTISQLG